MFIAVSEEVRTMSIGKNNILFKKHSSPLPFWNIDNREFVEAWIGISRDIFTRVDSNLMPGGESSTDLKHKPFSSSGPDEARMGHSNFHCTAPNISYTSHLYMGINTKHIRKHREQLLRHFSLLKT